MVVVTLLPCGQRAFGVSLGVKVVAAPELFTIETALNVWPSNNSSAM